MFTLKTKIILVIIAAIILLLIGLVIGWEAAGGLALFGAGGATAIKKRGRKIDQAEKERDDIRKEHDEEIAEAGEDIEAEKYDNADDARDYINDWLNSDS